MSILTRIFGTSDDRARYRPLYARVVELGRDPAWYREGGVPDTLDGRFDLIAAILALVLIRLETEARASVLVAELFIEDMDGSIRQMGIGDLMVGKHVGNMMAALGGRIGAFRDAQGDFGPAVRRNIFHDAPPSEEAVAFVAARLERFRDALAGQPDAGLLDGAVPGL